MSENEIYSKKVCLANGSFLSIADVVPRLGLLERLANDSEHGRRLLSSLRAGALSQEPIPEPYRQELEQMGLLAKNGVVDLLTSQVVLASVRGADTALYIDSPFTNSWDRTVADLIISRRKVRAVLPSEQAELLIASYDEGEANTEQSLRQWVSIVRRQGHGPGNTPPPLPN